MGQTKRPLEGVKVLELATFIAAPSCCRYLADLGAEIIKIEAPAGDPLRYTGYNEGRPTDVRENTSFDLDNANKKGITLNTKTPEGREILEKLIANTDIFVTNWRPNALKKAGLDYDSLHAKYPSLVYGIVSGYGQKGPDKDLPGFDFTAFFARGGIIGTLKDKDSVPMLTIPGLGDQQVGMYLASGIIAALYRAKTTGEGDQVVVSLLHTALWITAIMLQAAQYGKPSACYPISRSDFDNPLTVVHQTKDGKWLQIAMPQYDKQYPVFMEAAGCPDMINNEKFYPQKNYVNNKAEFYSFLVELMASKTCEEWMAILDAADLPYAKAQTWEEVLVDPQAWGSDCLYEMEYYNGAKRTLVRTPVMFQETGLPPYNRGPYQGEHTEEVLKELGYSDEEVAKFLEMGAACGLAPAYKD